MHNTKIYFITAANILIVVLCTSFAFSQPVVKVWGSENPQEIKNKAELYLNHLDVQENLHLFVKISPEMPKNLEGITISLPSPEPDSYQLLKVLIYANLSKKKQMLVLAHEMIHVKQYAKKELIQINAKSVIWKGKKHYYSGAYNQQMPWEKEAYQFDRPLAKLVEKDQEEIKEILTEQICKNTTKALKCKYL